ncbi:MAG: YhfC family intramembrane metalloprotease [Clostridia bacterium]|nr:YhfC family intramembrane metalloprotease [Clostridia bacterium]
MPGRKWYSRIESDDGKEDDSRMITASTYVGIALMIVFGLAIPVAAAVWWLKSHREKITTVLLGAATWFVFAMILETVPKAILFNPALPVGKAVMANAALYTVFGALLAGLFEETGRFIVFKTFLRRQTNRETGVSHGIGHGGMEAVLTLAVSGAQNLVFAVLIGTGMFQSLVDRTADKGADVSALQALPQQILSITPGTACLAGAERVFAMLLHVGLSVLVFYAVKQSRPLWYVLAILLHALFDVPAALYQFGALPNVYVVEAILAVYSIVFLAAVLRLLYRRDKTPQTAGEIQPDAPGECLTNGEEQ